jgi:molecular chaperone DnaK
LEDTLKLETATKEDIDNKTKALAEASQNMAQAAMAKQQGAEGAGCNTGGCNSKKDDDDVIDAEVEDEPKK